MYRDDDDSEDADDTSRRYSHLEDPRGSEAPREDENASVRSEDEELEPIFEEEELPETPPEVIDAPPIPKSCPGSPVAVVDPTPSLLNRNTMASK